MLHPHSSVCSVCVPTFLFFLSLADEGSREEAVEILNTFFGGANGGTSTIFFSGALALTLGSFSLLIYKRSLGLFFGRVALQVPITSSSVITIWTLIIQFIIQDFLHCQ